MTDKIKASLHQMIADGKTGGVAQQLLEITQYFGDAALEQKAVQIFTAFQAYRQQEGTLPAEEKKQKLEKINAELLELLDQIPAQGQAPMASGQSQRDNKDQNRSFPVGQLILILVIIGVILYLIFS